jgi:hypothetical protein
MPFSRSEVDALLVAVHRRCAICHRFCGIKIETDHIVPFADGGPDTIDNAIPVCFECHAEIHSYNDKHPRGRKFRPEELRGHKKEWLRLCRERPEMLIAVARSRDVGPIQAMIDELEFNAAVAKTIGFESMACLFLDEQFRRAVRDGAIAILKDEIKRDVIAAYVAMGQANQYVVAYLTFEKGSSGAATAGNRAFQSLRRARDCIDVAKRLLLSFLSSETDS